MITYSEYWREIGGIIDACFQEAQEYERIPHEVLHETIDGHNWVIYTSHAQEILRHSQNCDYAVENFGVEGLTEGGTLNWSYLAFGAMFGDCIESAETDRDWNEIPTNEEQENE